VPFLALYAGTAILANVVDGPWKSWDTGSEVDTYTLAHLVVGVVAQQMAVTEKEMVLLAIANEFMEAATRSVRPDLAWGAHESLFNRVLDVAANWAGWKLGELLVHEERGLK
jgi:hypothetical protein